MTDIFWKQWIKKYLTSHLQNIKVGDNVIIVEDNIKRSKWPLAKVVETFSGKDQLVCTAKVKTAINELVRPLAKLCLV